MNNTHCTQTLLASNNDDADDNDPDNICLFNFLYWLFLRSILCKNQNSVATHSHGFSSYLTIW